jgi:hypothetical protein
LAGARLSWFRCQPAVPITPPAYCRPWRSRSRSLSGSVHSVHKRLILGTINTRTSLSTQITYTLEDAGPGQAPRRDCSGRCRGVRRKNGPCGQKHVPGASNNPTQHLTNPIKNFSCSRIFSAWPGFWIGVCGGRATFCDRSRGAETLSDRYGRMGEHADGYLPFQGDALVREHKSRGLCLSKGR